VTLRRLFDEADWVLDRYEETGARGFFPQPPPHGQRLKEDRDEETSRTALAPRPPQHHGEPPGAPRGGEGASQADGQRAAPTGGERQMCAPGGCQETIAFVGADTPVGEPRWRRLERLLHRVLAEWNSLPHHPDPVFAATATAALSGRVPPAQTSTIIISTSAPTGATTLPPIALRPVVPGTTFAACTGEPFVPPGAAPDGVAWRLGTSRLARGAAPCTLIGERYLDGIPD
jgi:hypothetical protein